MARSSALRAAAPARGRCASGWRATASRRRAARKQGPPATRQTRRRRTTATQRGATPSRSACGSRRGSRRPAAPSGTPAGGSLAPSRAAPLLGTAHFPTGGIAQCTLSPLLLLLLSGEEGGCPVQCPAPCLRQPRMQFRGPLHSPGFADKKPVPISGFSWGSPVGVGGAHHFCRLPLFLPPFLAFLRRWLHQGRPESARFHQAPLGSTRLHQEPRAAAVCRWWTKGAAWRARDCGPEARGGGKRSS